MYNSYIRPLSFEYKDAHEKDLQVDEIPVKFKPQEDNYQKRVKARPVEIESQEEVVVYAPPPEPAPLPQKKEPQCNCCACLKTKDDSNEICEDCIALLCENCSRSPLQVKNCLICKQYLCPKCLKALKLKKSQLILRSYPIRFKDFTSLHFLECKCEHCHHL